MFNDYVSKFGPGPVPMQPNPRPQPVGGNKMQWLPGGNPATNPNPYNPDIFPSFNDPCSEPFRADYLEGASQRVWHPFYDSIEISQADPATRVTRMFVEGVGVNGKTKIETNFPGNGKFPVPTWFRMWMAGIYIVPLMDANTTTADWMLVANNLMVRLERNQKEVFSDLAWDMPAGGGQIIYNDPAVASTDAYAFNGIADQRAMKLFRVPVIFKPGQNFFWELEVDPNAWDSIGDEAKVNVYIIKHGEYYRTIE